MRTEAGDHYLVMLGVHVMAGTFLVEHAVIHVHSYSKM